MVLEKTVKTECMTDFHCHLLPGIDDGPATLEESVEIARILFEKGFTTVHCTPHCITGSYLVTPDIVKHEAAVLQQHLDHLGIPLHLVPGMEYYLDEYLIDLLDDHFSPVEERHILVEAPMQSGNQYLMTIIQQILRKRLTPLIAHPERCHIFQEASNQLLHELRNMGCRFQGNIGSFAGIYGSRAMQTAGKFLVNCWYDCYGSDAHDAMGLEEYLKKGLEIIEKGTVTLKKGICPS